MQLKVQVSYCFPYQTSQRKFVKFDGVTLEYVDTVEEATDFKHQENLHTLFFYLMLNKNAIRIENAMNMDFWCKKIEGNVSSYFDKLELRYS